MSTFTPPAIYWADPTTDPQPSGNRSFRWQYTNGTKHIYRGYNGSTIDAGPMEEQGMYQMLGYEHGLFLYQVLQAPWYEKTALCVKL